MQDTDTHGQIMGSLTVREVKEAVTRTGSYFFSTDTMRWFGTRNLAMVGGLVMVGFDSKAPDGVDAYWGRVFTASGSAEKVVSASTRRSAVSQARKVAKALGEEVK